MYRYNEEAMRAHDRTYRQHLIDVGALLPAGVWADHLPCLELTAAEREWFTNTALEWLSWWENNPEELVPLFEDTWSFDGWWSPS